MNKCVICLVFGKAVDNLLSDVGIGNRYQSEISRGVHFVFIEYRISHHVCMVGTKFCCFGKGNFIHWIYAFMLQAVHQATQYFATKTASAKNQIFFRHIF